MSLGFQLFSLSLDPAGVLGVKLAIRLERPPPGRLVSGALALAQAAMETKIPAVIGSVKSAPFSRAKYSRIAPTVVSLPCGTRRIILS